MTLPKRLLTKITVFEDHFTIDFKSAVTIEIKALERLLATDVFVGSEEPWSVLLPVFQL